MMLLTRNACLALLWGVSALFSVGSSSDTTPQTSTTNSTAEPNDATTHLNSSPVLHSESQTLAATPGLTHKPVATAETSASNAAETQEADVRSTGYGSNVSTTASGRPRVSTSAAKATPSHNKTTSDAAEPGPTTSAGTSPLETTTLMASTSSAAEPGPTTSARTSPPATTTLMVSTSDAAEPGPTTSARTSPPATTTLMASTSSAASSATAALSSLQSTSGPEATHESSSTDSSAYLTQASPSTQSVPTASASTVHASTTNRTGAAPVFDPTSSPQVIPDAATTRAELSSVPEPVSHDQTPTSTSRPPDTTRPASPATSGSVTAFSTSPAGNFIRSGPNPVPVLTTKSAAPTAPAPEASQSPPTTEVQACSSRGVVRQCLIIIASLAGLATIFMVSTIVLCAKLSARKHKARKPKQETEMMCISALLPERVYNYTRQRNPVPNGIQVLPTCRDSDDDIGDNLTLSSFLPENERIV